MECNELFRSITAATSVFHWFTIYDIKNCCDLTRYFDQFCSVYVVREPNSQITFPACFSCSCWAGSVPFRDRRPAPWSSDNLFLFSAPISAQPGAFALYKPWERGVAYVWRLSWALCSWSFSSSPTGTTSAALTSTLCGTANTSVALRAPRGARSRPPRSRSLSEYPARRGLRRGWTKARRGESSHSWKEKMRKGTRVGIRLEAESRWRGSRGSWMYVRGTTFPEGLVHLSRSQTGNWIIWS